MAEPREEGRQTVFSVVAADGEGRDVYVNPYGAEVLGSRTRTAPCRVRRSGCTAS